MYSNYREMSMPIYFLFNQESLPVKDSLMFHFGKIFWYSNSSSKSFGFRECATNMSLFNMVY